VRGDIARAYDFYRRALAYDKVSAVKVIVIVMVIAIASGLQYRSNAMQSIAPFHALHQFSHLNTIPPLPPHKNDAIALIMLGCLCGTTAVTNARSSSSSSSTAGTPVGNPAAQMSESKLPVTNGELDALLRRVCMSVLVYLKKSVVKYKCNRVLFHPLTQSYLYHHYH
jgi:hypothetical protein